MEKLRKVVFTLEQQEMSFMDYETPEECEEKTKERIGFFHCFGNEWQWSSDAGCYRDRVIGIVEGEDGKVYHVVPKFMRFLP